MDALRAPVDSPFTTDQLQFLISPAWLAYFVRGLTPALNDLIANVDPPNVPMEFGKDYPRQGDGSALGLSSVISTQLSRHTDGSALNVPMPTHRLAYDSPGFPPPAPRTVPRETLAMLAASQTGRVLPTWVISDTAANVHKYPPSAYPVNSLLYVTDRTVLYQNTGTAWIYVAGIYKDIFGNRPSLASSDAGFIFYSTDTRISYFWTGSVWHYMAGIYIDVFANRPTPSSTEGGYLFYATDTLVTYYWTGSAWNVLGPPVLTSGQIWVGNASNVATDVSMSGDITVNSAGVTVLKNTGPGAGTTSPVTSITIDAQGRITAIS